MAERLKELFNRRAVAAIARDLRSAHRPLDERAFVHECMAGLDGLELTARGRHIAEVMQRHLPTPFARAAKVLIGSLGPELERSDTFGLEPLRYMPHVFFVQKYGLDDFDAAMHAQYELTKRFSAEWSIRAFLVKYPEATYARLLEWTRDPSVHVRRLVSEGTRPRLPWAPRLRAYQEDPALVLRLLELLKDDPERYVQRSVANNLNDIGKDHPDLMVQTCRRWSKNASPGRTWIVKHALRSLVKKGHRGALEVLGVGATPRVNIEQVRVAPQRVGLGGEVCFSLCLVSTSTVAQALMVDYAVHFVKARGATRPKVFKLARLTLAPGQSVELSSRISFASMTTRRHYPGRHHIELLMNGVGSPLGDFEVHD